MMTPRSLRLLALAPLLAALACTTSTAPNGRVVARATAAGILAMNASSRPIFFVAVERNALALYDFGMCTDAQRCETIAPGASHTVAWSEVAGYAPDRSEYLFIWWQARDNGDVGLTGSVEVTR
jgi:hypothetical protein